MGILRRERKRGGRGRRWRGKRRGGGVIEEGWGKGKQCERKGRVKKLCPNSNIFFLTPMFYITPGGSI